jgi:hypothetical protein
VGPGGGRRDVSAAIDQCGHVCTVQYVQYTGEENNNTEGIVLPKRMNSLWSKS